MNVSIDIIGPNAFSDLSSSSPMLLPTKQIHVLTQNKGRGKSRSKLCYLLHLEKLDRLLKPTAKKSFIFTVGATRTFKIKCHPREVNNNPSTVWRPSLKLWTSARGITSLKDRLKRIMLMTLKFSHNLKDCSKCGTSQSMEFLRKKKKKNFKEMKKCLSWWQKLQDLRKPNKSPPSFWQKRLCTQRDDV